jgi:hypothetical protein
MPKGRGNSRTSAKKKAPKRKLKPEDRKTLAKIRETDLVLSQDVADAEAIVRHMSTEDLASSNAGAQALAIIQATQQASAAEQLAHGAFLDLLGADRVQAVREDDGSVWMFVPNDPTPGRWRGVIRERDGDVERSWFLPDEGKIVWELVTD